MLRLAQRLFGSANDRIVKKLQAQVGRINALEETMQALSDSELRAKTEHYRHRLTEGETLDSLLPEAFATVREAGRRVLGMRHFDVQMVGGLALHKGMIAEMRTGEGKTLVCTLAAYLNALPGKGVHVVTVNDYLAHRDAEWMGNLHRFLGLSVGCIVHGLTDEERRHAYSCDITYGTNNEFGFDFLRDNMKFSLEDRVQRDPYYAIIDEVDSILVDEARTPLIISGPTEDNSELYTLVDALIPLLVEGDFEKDEKHRTVTLTEIGTEHVENLLREKGMLQEGASLYDIENISLVHHVNQALRAHQLFTRDVDYMVKDNKVVIIDEFTGRMMEGRRYSDGLHQALEAKERVHIQNENQTLASVTFQNYFRMYPKLSGMTGTAMTEAGEFKDIYNLDVLAIPTHRPVSRQDFDDQVYRTEAEKLNAILAKIEECHAKGQPVLVGTVSIEKSETLSKLLKKHKIKHQVLNAKYHEQEAMIIAQAGRKGAVTIATNMAGRGTDIMLGGNAEMRILAETADLTDEHKKLAAVEKIRKEVEAEKQAVLEAGGLFVMGTERHESRRIDNQLRGRSGRQGDPGASLFYLSLQDDLMRIFGSERMDFMLRKLGLQEGEAIVHPLLSRTLEKAQQKVENRNYDIRKTLLKYDDVMNDQRKVVYSQRKDILESDDVGDILAAMREELVERIALEAMPAKAYPDQWDMPHFENEVARIFNLHLPLGEWAQEEGIADREVVERVMQAVENHYQQRVEGFGAEIMALAEKRMLLMCFDQLWKDHLHRLDHLRQGINLRAYAQRDPLNEYKQEAFTMFEVMLDTLKEEVCARMSRLEITVSDRAATEERLTRAPQAPHMHESRQEPLDEETASNVRALPKRSKAAPLPMDPNQPESWGKTRRNDPCPCGSGKKYKHCHGAVEVHQVNG